MTMHAARVTGLLAGLSLIVALAGCKSAQDLALRGDDYYMQGQYARALADYRDARRKDPEAAGLDEKILRTQVRLFIHNGDDAVARNRFADAQHAYEEASRLDPDNPDLPGRFERLTDAQAQYHYQQGQRLLSAGDPFGALPELELALELRPGNARTRSAIDRARQEQADRRARAETTYQQSLQASKAGRFEEALDLLDLVLKLDPNHPGAAFEREQARAALVEDLIDRGDAAIDRGAWKEALGLYDQARTHDPFSDGLYARLEHAQREVAVEQWLATGDQARARGDWREAFESYEQARLLTAEPQRVRDRLEEARRSYVLRIQTDARAAESGHRYEEALAGYRRILEVQPDHADASRWFDELTARIDLAEAAYRAAARAQRRGDLVAAQASFSQCTAALPGYLDAAERLEAVTKDVDLAGTLYDRARGAERAGRNDRACVLFEECLSVAHPFRDVQQRLQQVRAALSDGREIYAPYEDACRAQAQRDFQRAQTLLLQCRKERPGYADVADRLKVARRALEEAEAAYRRAEQAERRQDLAEARDGFAGSLRACAGYRDAEDRLDRLDSGQKWLREARRFEEQHRIAEAVQRYRQVLDKYPDHPEARQHLRQLDEASTAMDADYKRLLEAERKGDYRGALTLALGIRKTASGYRDLAERTARLETEADYADARAFEDAGRWELAARTYQSCIDRDPGFRDARSRLESCRGKVAQGGGDDDGDNARWPARRGSGRGK